MGSARAIAVTVLGAALICRVAFAHPDTLGTPDPYWQTAPVDRTQPTAGALIAGAAASDGATHPQLLRGYLYVAGGVVVLVALSLLRSV